MSITDFELKLNQQIDAVKNNPEAIKQLVKDSIKDFGEEIARAFLNKQKQPIRFNVLSVIEDSLLDREIDNYNTDLFYQY